MALAASTDVEPAAMQSFCSTIARNMEQAQLLADPMQEQIMQHAAADAAAPVADLSTAATPAADGSSSELVSGGYTLPRPPAAVNNVIAKPQEVVFANAPVYQASYLASSEDDGL
jgi:hypothetical protein